MVQMAPWRRHYWCGGGSCSNSGRDVLWITSSDIHDSTEEKDDWQAALLQTYLAEITRSSDEHHSDVGRRVVVRMPRYNADDTMRFLYLGSFILYTTHVSVTVASWDTGTHTSWTICKTTNRLNCNRVCTTPQKIYQASSSSSSSIACPHWSVDVLANVLQSDTALAEQ